MKKQQNMLSRKSLNRLSNRAFRANRARNAFAVLAVLLTTLLLTCVFSIGFSFSKNLATMELRTKGTTAQLLLPALRRHSCKSCVPFPTCGRLAQRSALAPSIPPPGIIPLFT